MNKEQRERLKQIREQHQQRVQQNRDDTDSHFDIDLLLSLLDSPAAGGDKYVCDKCGQSDEHTLDIARAAAEEISSTFGLKLQDTSLRQVAAIISKHLRAATPKVASDAVNPWPKLIRKYKDDPAWQKFGAFLQEYRAVVDELYAESIAAAPADNEEGESK